MGLYKCTIGTTDVTDYLKDWSVEPGVAGATGGATLYLTQEAGGLDLRPRMDVKLWVPYNTGTGAGVAERGRLFGGLVSDRDTGNSGTTKIWELSCEDWNTLLDIGATRDMQPARAISLTAGTFSAQIQSLVLQIQRNGYGAVAQSIDASTHVANLHASMPAVVMEPGHKLGYYIQYLCNTARTLDSALAPGFFIGFGTTFGAAESFDGPVLHIFDRALSPTPAYVFSDTPTGTEKPIYGQFRRTTSAGGKRAIQRLQGRWGDQVYTAENATSQAAYPNPYINHGLAGDKGYWMLEPVDIQATTTTEAQAAVDAAVAAVAYPSDTIEFDTYEPVQPYDPVAIEWDLEAITSATVYRIAKLSKRPEGVAILTTVQLNNRRRGIMDDGSDEYPMLPVEGDRVPPLPVDDFDIAGTSYDYVRHEAVLHATWSPSASPDTAGYYIFRQVSGQEVRTDVGNVTEYDYRMEGDTAYTLDVRGYDRSGNLSDPSNVETGTSPGPVLPTAPTISSITHARQPDGLFVATVNLSHAGDHSNGGHIEYHQGSGPSRTVPYARNRPTPNYTVPVPNLNTGTYQFAATAIDQYGQESDLSTPEVSHTFSVGPRRNPDPNGWDSAGSDDEDRGLRLVPSTTAGLSFADATTHEPYEGTGTSAVLTNSGADANTAYDDYPIAVTDGEVLVLGAARYIDSSLGAGTIPNTALKYNWYDEDGVQVGSEGTVFDAVATGAWDYDEAVITAPAGAKTLVPRLQQWDPTSAQVGTYASYFSPVFWERQVSTNQLAAGAVTGAKLAANLVYDAPSEAGALTGRVTNADTTGVARAMHLQHRLSSGTPGPGIGTALRFQADSTSGQDANLAQIYAAFDSLSPNKGRMAFGVGDVGTIAERADLSNTAFRVMQGTSLVVGNLALSTGNTDGFLYLPSMPGKPTATPTSRSGTYPVVWDSTNKVLWYYDGSWKVLTSEGTAFPASPYTGMRFYRSDLMVECYYDGTRWLGPETPLPLHNYKGTPPFAATEEILAASARGGQSVYITRWDVSYYVNSTNNGSNYWTVKLRRLTSGVSVSDMASVSTSSVAADTWTHATSVTSFSNNPVLSSDIWTQVYIQTTGSPGSIYVQSLLWGRVVYT